jgi:hypothetical protein
MSVTPDRIKIAHVIIYCHLILIGIVIILLISGGIIQEELTALLSLLLPITTLYGGTVFQHLAENIKGRPINDEPVPHSKLVKRLILLHFSLMVFLIACKTVFNWLEFSAMLTLMTLVEASFGGYMGIILHAVFGQGNNNKNSD